MRSVRKWFLTVFGVLFIVFGIGAFAGFPGGHDSSHHTTGHNLTHIIAGLACIAVAWAGESVARRRFCFALGAIYILAGIIGVYTVRENLRIIPGVIEFHLEDSWIQIGTGILFLTLGALRASPSRYRGAWVGN